MPRLHLGHRDDALLERIAPPRDEALQARHHVGGNEHGIDRLVWRRGMAAATDDRNLELVHRGHDRSGHDADRAGGEIVPQVNAERRVHPRCIEHAVGDHRLRAIADFFRGLERELDRPAELHRRQPARHLEPDRDVPIVPAGVHDAVVPRLVCDVVLLLHGEGVHVCPQ